MNRCVKSINIKFNNVNINEIVTSLAEYIHNGYGITTWSTHSDFCCGCTVEVELRESKKM